MYNLGTIYSRISLLEKRKPNMHYILRVGGRLCLLIAVSSLPLLRLRNTCKNLLLLTACDRCMFSLIRPAKPIHMVGGVISICCVHCFPFSSPSSSSLPCAFYEFWKYCILQGWQTPPWAWKVGFWWICGDVGMVKEAMWHPKIFLPTPCLLAN